ncbi:MAG: hypothetical protein A3B81_03935 [Candidatus Muproteobacteria bacterium RIFCSPHIGHO2_02_FULL_65_16]|uniref:Glycosyltransferase 2-like domain-containing protein n=1 Tax=Candidatus Muproteobacteria bacterium RIFCSPHIGHO2_02_FULL_65_16 TaxID=1817766 RepID=A0A1F6TWH2_9PROT|nr:MAG: hypothetical protein A3B81_03935 [Candidatus Muproteobacteria bacterium RIFCSPHIGHO2_02_FULL_65_16]
MSWPKISVVTPSYNQGRFIEATLLSVLNQNYPNLEYIVVDGGSADESIEIIKKYEHRLAYWVSEPDGGQTKGLIKGFRRATGEIQCWLNSDDLLQPGTLSEVAAYFLDHPRVDAVYGNALWIDVAGQLLREQREIPFSRFVWLYTYNYIPCMSMFWRKPIYDKVGGLDQEFDLAMDADLWIRFAEVGRIAHVRSVWSCMRFYPEQKNRRLREKSDAEDMRIRQRYGVDSGQPLYRAKRFIAQAVRLAWRLLTGCYPLGYRRYMERS